MVKITVFISSKMLELRHERELIQKLLPSLNQGMVEIVPWIFEDDAPASEESIRDVYLQALQNSALYIGIFWNAYGEWTIDEFERAGEWNIPRHIYVKNVNAYEREPKLDNFLQSVSEVENGITPKWFQTDDELKEAIQDSISEWLKNTLMYRSGASTAILYADPDDIVDLTDVGLFGRDSLIQNIQNELSNDNARVLLQGFGGIGKTALAAHTAYHWIEENKQAVLWLRMGSSEIDAVYEALSHPFGASKAMVATPDEQKKQLLRQLIRSTDVGLVVLDDIWNGTTLKAIQQAIPRKVPLLITARQRYPLSTLIEIPDLPKDDAIALLRKLAPNLANEDESAYALCEKLSYHAFAIEIAGRTMQATNYTAKKMLADIENTVTTLEVPLEYREAGRENIAALIETTLNELPEEAKTVFLAWGAFWSPQITPELIMKFFADTPIVTNEMIEKTREVNPHLPKNFSQKELIKIIQESIIHHSDDKPMEDALNILQKYGLCKLFNAHFTSDGRPITIASYRLHDLAFEYAKLQNDTSNRLKAAHACLMYSNRYIEGSLENFASLEPEIDNFMGAANFAMVHEQYDFVEQFATNLYNVADGVLYYRGLYFHGKQLLEKAIIAARNLKHTTNVGVHLGNLGTTYEKLGLYEKAAHYYQESLKVFEAIDDKGRVGVCFGNLGNIYYLLQKKDKAHYYLEFALTISREVGDKVLEGNTLSNIGNMYYANKDYNQAISYHEQALKIAEEIEDLRAVGYRLTNLGTDYHSLENFEKALVLYEKSLSIKRSVGDILGEASTLNNIGAVYIFLEDFKLAIHYLEQSLMIYRQLQVSHRIEHVSELLNAVRTLQKYNMD